MFHFAEQRNCVGIWRFPFVTHSYFGGKTYGVEGENIEVGEDKNMEISLNLANKAVASEEEAKKE